VSDLLLEEERLLKALDAALESASACGAAVGVVVLRDAGIDGAARRLADAAIGLLPAGGIAGALGRDRVALVLPGYAGAAARGVAERIAATFDGVAAGWAAATPERSPHGPLDLLAEAEGAAALAGC